VNNSLWSAPPMNFSVIPLTGLLLCYPTRPLAGGSQPEGALQSASRRPAMSVRVAKVAVEMRLDLQKRYQLEGSKDRRTWQSLESPFVAQNVTETREFSRADGFSFRLTRLLSGAENEMGRVVGWGLGEDGQITSPPNLSGVIAVGAGYKYSAGLRQDGSIIVWGNNEWGQGNVPTDLNAVRSIACGARHLLALNNDGTVVAWGANESGQSTVPPGLNTVIAVAAGDTHSLALKQDGTVIGWGATINGQLPIPESLERITSITVSDSSNLVLSQEGIISAWGSNFEGKIVVPTGLGKMSAISAGGLRHLALRPNGTLVEWGSSLLYDVAMPPGLKEITMVAAGAHSVVLKQDGTISAWGHNAYGQCDVPQGLENVRFVAVGKGHSLAVMDGPFAHAPGAMARAETPNPSTQTIDRVQLTYGGEEYTNPPSIQVVGGGGGGATLEATVRDGAVVGLRITNPGRGYKSRPTIQIEPPQPRVTVKISKVALELKLVPGRKYAIEASKDLNLWVGDDAFIAETENLSKEIELTHASSFFRLTELP
jgi:hypothetical protein